MSQQPVTSSPSPVSLAASSAPASSIPASSYYALFVLFLVYSLNFLDRALINILFPPIKREMVLTDLQLALLGSTSFVIFYTLLGIPFGHLSDRVVRKRLIAAGLAVWCVFSGLTGFAHGFVAIFLCRVFVGVGEATLGPAALSLLSDLFPRRMRATASAVYSAGIPTGAALAFYLGGLIGERFGWRWAFYLLGFPGLALCVVVLLLREPQRGQVVAEQNPEVGAAGDGDWRILLRVPALRYHNLGYALLAVAANALNMWIPTYMIRVFHMNLAQVGKILALLTITGGLSGTVLGGIFADRLRRLHPGGRMIATSLGALLCVPMWLMLLSAKSLTTFLLPCFVLAGCGLMWLGPAAADVHDIVGPRLRGLGIGVYYFVVNIIGYGIGPPIFGALNDAVGAAKDPEQMRRVLLLSPLLCLVSAGLLYLGSRSLARAALRR